MSGLYAILSQLSQEPPSSRKSTIEDFFDCNPDDIHKQYTHNDDYIEKNQRNYGHRKRIKP